MRAGGARRLVGSAAVVGLIAGCAATGTGASPGAPPAPGRMLPVFEGLPEYVAGATVWTGASALRPPLQVADSILEHWGWTMARANAAGTMSTDWAYFSAVPPGAGGDPCTPDRLGAVRLVLDPEDGGRTLGLRAEAQFASGADHERAVGFAREALSVLHETTQDAVNARATSNQPGSARPTPSQLPWPGFGRDRVVPCAVNH